MTHVQPGDEVFSGEVLLTLEKLDHLRTIEAQQVRVRELQNELQKAEAQARLNIDLKQSEIECQLFELQAQLESARADSPAEADAAPAVVLSETAGKELPLVTVSSSNEVTQHRPRPGGLIFFSGESGQATPFTAMQEAATAAGEAPNFSLPPAAKPVSGPSAPKPSADEVRIVDLESRLRKLEDLQELMPDRILQAAGIEQMRMHLEDARKTLEAMQSASREISVVSPSYGVVGQIRHRAGDLLESGDVLLKILHSERRFVVVYVPTDAIGQLQSGSRVKLRYPGHEEYEGLVTAIPSIVDAASPGTSTLAAVRVEESGRMWPELPIGSRVDVVMN